MEHASRARDNEAVDRCIAQLRAAHHAASMALGIWLREKAEPQIAKRTASI
jgi:hypothetical protein